MNSIPRIVVLCSGESAFPTIQLLGLENFLAGIVVTSKTRAVAKKLKSYCADSKISFLNITRNEISDLSDWIKRLQPDAAFCIGFPYYLSDEIRSLMPDRFFNFHMGKLPDYRGPMPIFETLKAGEKETAVTVHRMNEAFDKGDIIFAETLAVSEEETFGSLAVQFAESISLAAQNLAQMIQFGNRLPSRQQKMSSSFYSYPDHKDTTIKWDRMRAEEIISLANACNPWNVGADTHFLNKPFKLVSAFPGNEQHNVEPGTILNIEAHNPVTIACIDGETIHTTIVSSAWGIEPAYRLFQRIARTGCILGNFPQIATSDFAKFIKTTTVT